MNEELWQETSTAGKIEQGNHLKRNTTKKHITVKNKWDIYSLFLIFVDFALLLFKIFSRLLLNVKIEILYLGSNNNYLIGCTESQTEPSSFLWHWSYSSGFGKESKICDQTQDIVQYPGGDQKELHLEEIRYYKCFHSVRFIAVLHIRNQTLKPPFLKSV